MKKNIITETSSVTNFLLRDFTCGNGPRIWEYSTLCTTWPMGYPIPASVAATKNWGNGNKGKEWHQLYLKGQPPVGSSLMTVPLINIGIPKNQDHIRISCWVITVCTGTS